MHRNVRNKRTIPALFAQKVLQHPDKPALIFEATGEVRKNILKLVQNKKKI